MFRCIDKEKEGSGGQNHAIQEECMETASGRNNEIQLIDETPYATAQMEKEELYCVRRILSAPDGSGAGTNTHKPRRDRMSHYGLKVRTSWRDYLDYWKQFRRNDPFKDWCEKLCINQHFASVKHSQTNGLVERANRSLGEGIKARLEARSNNWMEETLSVLWAHAQ
ncbi:reverse transcriptase domain-containing protein [Tanacetum coccineum]